MNCKKYTTNASAYLDRLLSDGEAADYHAHIFHCAGCRDHLAETEIASMMLRRAGRAEVPRELHSYILTAVERRAMRQMSFRQRMVEWMLQFNPKPLSYATGVIVSVLLFAFMLSGFRPIPVNRGSLGEVTVFPPLYGSDAEYHNYNETAADRDSVDNQHFYELPRVRNNSSMVSLSSLAYEKSGDEGVSALIEVGPDGRAKILDWLQEPEDARVVEQLWWTFTERSFQPALVEGKPVKTRIVFVAEKIDVSG